MGRPARAQDRGHKEWFVRKVVELPERRLRDLVSVGPATVGDLEQLGIGTVEELAQHDAHDLYERMCSTTGFRHDPCCEDTFAAAIAQARDPDLPEEKKRWWYWTRLRKQREEAAQRRPGRRRTSSRGATKR